MKVPTVEDLFLKFFLKLASHTSRKPWHFIIGSLSLGFSIILIAGLRLAVTKDLNFERNPVYLYSPYYGVVVDDKRIVEELFPSNTSDGFDYSTSIVMGYLGLIIFRAADNGTILRKSLFEEIMKLDDIVKNINVEWGGERWNYSSLCITYKGKCHPHTGDYVYKRIEAIEEGKYKLPYPVYIDVRNLWFELYGSSLGGVLLDKNGNVESAKAIMFRYHLKSDTEEERQRAALWENAFIDTLQKFQPKKIVLNYFQGHSTEQEIMKNILSVIPYLMGAFTMMIVFTFGMLSLEGWVLSKPWLGFIGCMSATFSVAVGIAFGYACGIKFVEINAFITFLILGIGMDDTFMLITAWIQTDPQMSIESRLRTAYSHVGVSITITSVTNLLSFLIGAISPLPAIFYFCIYMAIALVFCFIFQITLFGGFLVVFAHMERQKRHALLFWKEVATPEQVAGRSFLYKFLMSENTEGDQKMPGNSKINCFFRDKLGGLLIRPEMKFLVLLIFVAYLSIGIMGMGNIREGLDTRDLVRVDSYAYDMFGVMQKYFTKYQIRYQVVLSEALDYSDPAVQAQIESMLTKFESIPNTADPSLTWSWLRAYKLFMTDYRTRGMLHGFNLTSKEDFIRGLKDVFLKYPLGRLFKKDILFNENFTDIVATRYFMLIYELADSSAEKNLYQDIIDVKETLPFKVAVYNQFFPFFYQYTILKSNTLKSIGIAMFVLMLTVFAFVPNIACALAVTFSVLSIEVGVMGIMAYWNVTLTGIVMMSLVMCTGLSVDYAAHVSYAYISSDKKDSHARLMHSLFCTGNPIMLSSLSTLISISLVFCLPSQTFLSPAKNIFLLIIFAIFHALFLLPILLTFGADFFKLISKSEQKENLDTKKCIIQTIDTSLKTNNSFIKDKEHCYTNQNYIDSENPFIIIKL